MVAHTGGGEGKGQGDDIVEVSLPSINVQLQANTYSITTFTNDSIWFQRTTKKYVNFESASLWIKLPDPKLLAFHHSLCCLVRRTGAAPLLNQVFSAYNHALETLQLETAPGEGAEEQVFRIGMGAFLPLATWDRGEADPVALEPLLTPPSVREEFEDRSSLLPLREQYDTASMPH